MNAPVARMLLPEIPQMRVSEGVIENGQIRLRENVALPEHATVYVIIPDAETVSSAPAHVRSPRLADPTQASDFRKQVVEPSSDARV